MDSMDCEMKFEALSSSGEDESEEEEMEVSSNSLVDNYMLQKTMKQIFEKEKTKMLTKKNKRAKEPAKRKTMFKTSSDEDESRTTPKKSKSKKVVTIADSEKQQNLNEDMTLSPTDNITLLSPNKKQAEGSVLADPSHCENSNDSEESSATAVKIVGVIEPVDVEMCEKADKSSDGNQAEEHGVDTEADDKQKEVVEKCGDKKILPEHSGDEDMKTEEEDYVHATTTTSPTTKKTATSKVTKATESGKKPRFKRCKECENCKRELKDSCGNCAPCLNKHWKKPCVLRQCLNKAKQQDRRKTKGEQIAVLQERNKSKFSPVVITPEVKDEDKVTQKSPTRGSTAVDGDVEITEVQQSRKRNKTTVKATKNAEGGDDCPEQPVTKFISLPQVVVRPVVSMTTRKPASEVKKVPLHCNICYTDLRSKDELISHLYDHFAEERSKEAAQKASESQAGKGSTTMEALQKDASPRKLLVHKFRNRSTPARSADTPTSLSQSEDRASTKKKTSFSDEKIINPIVKAKKRPVAMMKKRGLFFEASSSEDEETTQSQQHSKSTDRVKLKCPHCRLVCKSQPGLRAHLLIYHPNHPSTANTQQSIFPAMSPSLSPARTGPIISPSQRSRLAHNSPIITQRKLNFAESSSSTRKNLGHSVMLIDKQGKSINLIGKNSEKSSPGNGDEDCTIVKLTPPPTQWVEKQGDKTASKTEEGSADQNADNNSQPNSNENNGSSGNNETESAENTKNESVEVLNNDGSEKTMKTSDDNSQKINIRIFGNSSSGGSNTNSALLSPETDNGGQKQENTGEIRLYI